MFFNQTMNIIISFIAAKAVVEGEMTLGGDDVSDLYHRSAQCAGLFFYRICAAVSGRQDKSGTAE